MEKLLDLEHGLPTLVASLVIILALHLFMRIGEFLWRFREKKEQADQESLNNLIKTLQEMNIKFQAFERDLVDFPKFKKDLNRMFSVLKLVAGNNWSSIMHTVLEDERIREGK